MAPRPLTNFRLPEALRRRIDVATASATQALIETHATYGVHLVQLLEDQLPFDEVLDRYLEEMGASGNVAASVRTRVLVALEELERMSSGDGVADEQAAAGTRGWRRFRPDAVVRGLRQRQRQQEEVERILQLAIAQAEEGIIRTHIEQAVNFIALLDEHLELERCVEYYLDEIGLSGCRGQTVLQRTIHRVAAAQLPEPRPVGRG